MSHTTKTDHDVTPTIACVVIGALPMQLLLRRAPTWQREAVAVVTEPRPQGKVLAINANARQHGIVAGMTFATARTLCVSLRADVVPQEEIDEAVLELTTALTVFSPRIEPDPNEPGVFWIDPTGLSGIYGGARTWARSVERYLAGRSLHA